MHIYTHGMLACCWGVRGVDPSNCLTEIFSHLKVRHLLRPIAAALMTSSVCRPHCHFQHERVIEISPVKNVSIRAFQGAGLNVHAN